VIKSHVIKKSNAVEIFIKFEKIKKMDGKKLGIDDQKIEDLLMIHFRPATAVFKHDQFNQR